MSGVNTVARQVRDGDGRPASPEAAPVAVEFHYNQTDSFVALLHQLGASLLVSTYQANKLLVIRAEQNGLSTLVRTFDRPMGLAADGRRLALGTRTEVWLLHNAPDIAPRIEPAGHHDACYLPRSCHVTGDIGIHEMVWARTRGQGSAVRSQGSGVRGQEEDTENQLWAVNTRFSCLCTLHPDYSFVPRWRPPFISALAAEDRCHLNGLALVEGAPGYATALGETDTAGAVAVKIRHSSRHGQEDFLYHVLGVLRREPLTAAPAIHQRAIQVRETPPGLLIAVLQAFQKAQGGRARKARTRSATK